MSVARCDLVSAISRVKTATTQTPRMCAVSITPCAWAGLIRKTAASTPHHELARG